MCTGKIHVFHKGAPELEYRTGTWLISLAAGLEDPAIIWPQNTNLSTVEHPSLYINVKCSVLKHKEE